MQNSAETQDLLKSDPLKTLLHYWFAKVAYYFGYRVLDSSLKEMVQTVSLFVREASPDETLGPLMADLRNAKPVSFSYFIGMLLVNQAHVLRKRMLLLSMFCIEVERVHGHSPEETLDWVKDHVLYSVSGERSITAEQYFKQNR